MSGDVAIESYLDLYMEPLRGFLERPEVTDLYVNRPGEVWVETLAGEIERHDAPALGEAQLWRLAHQIAHRSHQGVSRSHPLLAAILPDGSRVQIVAPPATRGDMAVAIRRHAAATPPLESYAAETLRRPTVATRAELESHLAARDYPAVLRLAVHLRLNIVISGGTSSGKTTLLNTLLAQVPPHERLILIEDTPELKLTHPNAVGLVAARGRQGEADVTPTDLLTAALRMRPDRILLGELRGPEAFTFLRGVNTGHPGSMTTIHADGPERALTQLALMALEAGASVHYSDLRELIGEMVDVVAQVERNGKERRIESVRLKAG